MDFSTLTGAVDFATVVAAIMALGAVKVLPIAAKWGVGKVLAMIGR